MRKYTLASPSAKSMVDLRMFADVITEAVHQYMPLAAVRVEKDCYYVDPTPSQGDAIRIGRQICQSDLKVYCIQIPKLFSSIQIGGKKDGTRKKRTGGHI